jgi:hypothetical protein
MMFMDFGEIVDALTENYLTFIGLGLSLVSALALYYQPEYIQWTQQNQLIGLAVFVLGAALMLYDLWEG